MNLEMLSKWQEELSMWNEKWSNFIKNEIEESDNRLFYLIGLSDEIVEFLKELQIMAASWDSGIHFDDGEEFHLITRYNHVEYKMIGTFIEGDNESEDVELQKDFFDLLEIKNRKEKIALFDGATLTESNIAISEIFSRFDMKQCILSLSNLAEEFNEQLLNSYENQES